MSVPQHSLCYHYDITTNAAVRTLLLTHIYKTEQTLMQIGIAKPFIGDEEKQAVLAVLDSGQLIQGAKVAEFEQAFAAYHGAKHGIATSNGTTALMAVMMAHGIAAWDEPLIPSFIF